MRLLQPIQLPQAFVPVGFERIGDQPVGGIDVKIATACQFRLVARPGQLRDPLGCGLFDDGRLLPKLELSRAPVRKGVIYDAWVGDAARRELGNKRWSTRVAKAIEGLRPMLLWDHLYVGGGNAKKLTVDLGPGVTLVPNEAGVTGGIRLWDLNEDKC